MLDWSAYDAERTRKARGKAGVTAADRAALESLLTGVLELSPADAARTWGDAIGYGLDAIVVVRVRDGIAHAHSAAGFPVAVKVYRTRKPRLVAWHGRLFRRAPGLAGNPRVQQSVAAGDAIDGRGHRRSYAVVQYVPGVLLEGWLAEHAPPPDRTAAILREVFEMVFGFWSAGLRPWDVRPGNLILDLPTGRLTLIDTDASHRTIEDVLERPDDWLRRDAVEQRFLRRLPANVLVPVLTGRKPGPLRQDRKLVRDAADALADSGLDEAMRALGRPDAPPNATRQARAALDAFLALVAGDATSTF